MAALLRQRRHCALPSAAVIKRISSQIARGFAMGAADVVPGVSGGTVALLLGIYDQLVGEVRSGAGALSKLVRGDLAGFWSRFKSIDWVFMISLLAGIGMAVVVLVSWIRHQIETNPMQVSAVFFGLVAASVVIASREVKQWDATRVALGLAMAAVAFFALGVRSGAVNDPSWVVVFGAGSIAICAMILPGISGSFILLMLGLYDHVTEAIDERHLSTVAVFGAGAIVGLALFSTLLNWVLLHHRDTVMAILIGLMLGSLRVLWPWPSTAVGESNGLENVDLGAPVSGEVLTAAICASLAAIAVVAMSEIARRSEASS
jgi:putative membrane protein